MRLLHRFSKTGANHRATGYWVGALLALLLVLNICGFFLYAKAHPNEATWKQMWSYLESDTAKLVSASLVFPLLIFIVEGRFNLLEAIRAARVDRRKRAQEERREARLQSIERSSQMWSRLTSIVNDVVYWDGTSSLRDPLKELVNVQVDGGDILNEWRRFPNLVGPDPESAPGLHEHFLTLANVLLFCTESTVHHFQETSDSTEHEDLQAALNIIRSAIERAVHQPVLNILNASLELMEIIESEDVEELRLVTSQEQAAHMQGQLERVISENLATLESWSTVVKGFLARSTVLATARGDEVEAFRSVYGQMHPFEGALGERVPSNQASEELRDRYFAIPRAERLRGWQTSYTKAWLLEFSDEMAFLNLLRPGVRYFVKTRTPHQSLP